MSRKILSKIGKKKELLERKIGGKKKAKQAQPQLLHSQMLSMSFEMAMSNAQLVAKDSNVQLAIKQLQ